MKIAIYTRQKNSIAPNDFKRFVNEMLKHNFECVFHKNFHSILRPLFKGQTFHYFNSALDLANNIEVILTVGGDGTLLDVVSLLRERSIPILGINFGRLGFLAVIGRDNLSELFKSLIDRTFFIEERMLLHADTSLETASQFKDVPFALNDCVIRGLEHSAMLNVKTYLNGEYLTSYWGDGIIVSTPTGSTGYSLSCSGPIVFPDINSLLITPIAAHNLNCRPIIVSENSIISISVETRSSKFLCSLDSRHFEFSTKVRIAIKQENFKVKLIRFTEKSFLHTLKQKLNWGFDTRNQQDHNCF